LGTLFFLKMAINFFSGKKEFRSLSNFWEYDVVIDGRVYPSGEHAFHGEKFIRLGLLIDDQDRAARMMDYGATFMKPSYQTPALAKKMGGKKGFALKDYEIIQWSRISLDVQRDISRFKFDNYQQVRQDLLASKGKILIHPALRCSKPENCFWEGKFVDGAVVGANHLGYIWMQLRDTL